MVAKAPSHQAVISAGAATGRSLWLTWEEKEKPAIETLLPGVTRLLVKDIMEKVGRGCLLYARFCALFCGGDFKNEALELKFN